MRAMAVTMIILTGCTSLANWQPYVREVTDRDRYAADADLCRQYALDYKPGLSLEAVGSGAMRGAAANAAGGALEPLVPAVGALGGATGEVISGLDLLSADAKKVFVICLRSKTEKDGSALVLDPHG